MWRLVKKMCENDEIRVSMPVRNQAWAAKSCLNSQRQALSDWVRERERFCRSYRVSQFVSQWSIKKFSVTSCFSWVDHAEQEYKNSNRGLWVALKTSQSTVIIIRCILASYRNAVRDRLHYRIRNKWLKQRIFKASITQSTTSRQRQSKQWIT